MISNPDITFKYIPSNSLVRGIANREIGLNFKSCNGPARTPIDLYKNSRIYFTNEMFEILHNHPYRRRLYPGYYILNHLHSKEKRIRIEKILKKYNGKLYEVAEFWWSQTSIKFNFNFDVKNRF